MGGTPSLSFFRHIFVMFLQYFHIYFGRHLVEKIFQQKIEYGVGQNFHFFIFPLKVAKIAQNGYGNA